MLGLGRGFGSTILGKKAAMLCTASVEEVIDEHYKNQIDQIEVDEKNLKEKIIEAGESFHFPPFCIHQEEAITDCLIIEVTTPHLNDRVRMEKFFGINKIDGLPSTSKDEIFEK